MRVPPIPDDSGPAAGESRADDVQADGERYRGDGGGAWFRPGRDPAGEPVSLPAGLAEAAAGPELAALLDDVGFAEISGRDTVEAMTVAYRQACHCRAVFLLALLETGLRQPGSADVVRRVAHPGEFAAEEARAALVWSRRRADTAFNLAYTVFHRLPEIGAAMLAGDLDEPRAAALASWTGELSEDHAAQVCAEVLPAAPAMTVGALIDEIKRLAVALDPDWAERTYRAAVRDRDVVGVRNPTGTVDVTGRNLPVDRAAAGCDRINALARQCKRAGDRRRIGQIRAELFLGMLDGTFTELNDQHIIDHVRTHHPPDNNPDTGDDSDGGSDGGGSSDGGGDGDGDDGDGDGDGDRGGDTSGGIGGSSDDPGAGPDDGGGGGGGGARGGGDDNPSTDDAPDDHVSGDDTVNDNRPENDRLVNDSREDNDPQQSVPQHSVPQHSGPVADGGSEPGSGRWSVRELRAQLATLVGVDEQPAELPGWGYVPPGLARELAAGMTTAQWRYVVCDSDGYPVDVGLVRRRPRGPSPGSHNSTQLDRGPADCDRGGGDRGGGDRGGGGHADPAGAVELAIHAHDLERLASEVAAGQHQEWGAVIAEIARAYACASVSTDEDGRSSTSRFATGRLRRWILTRDRMCTHPSCRAPASGVDVDHSVDHADGGETVDANLGGRCRHDHSVKHAGGWRIVQVSPFLTVWISPLGHRYENRPPPVIQPPARTSLRPVAVPETTVPQAPVHPPCDGECNPNRWCPQCRPILPPPRPLRQRLGQPNTVGATGHLAEHSNTGDNLPTDETDNDEPEWRARPQPQTPTGSWFKRFRDAADQYQRRQQLRGIGSRLPAHWAGPARSRLHYGTNFEFELERRLRTEPHSTDNRHGHHRHGDHWRGDRLLPAEASQRKNHGETAT